MPHGRSPRRAGGREAERRGWRGMVSMVVSHQRTSLEKWIFTLGQTIAPYWGTLHRAFRGSGTHATPLLQDGTGQRQSRAGSTVCARGRSGRSGKGLHHHLLCHLLRAATHPRDDPPTPGTCRTNPHQSSGVTRDTGRRIMAPWWNPVGGACESTTGEKRIGPTS